MVWSFAVQDVGYCLLPIAYYLLRLPVEYLSIVWSPPLLHCLLHSPLPHCPLPSPAAFACCHLPLPHCLLLSPTTLLSLPFPRCLFPSPVSVAFASDCSISYLSTATSAADSSSSANDQLTSLD